MKVWVLIEAEDAAFDMDVDEVGRCRVVAVFTDEAVARAKMAESLS